MSESHLKKIQQAAKNYKLWSHDHMNNEEEEENLERKSNDASSTQVVREANKENKEKIVFCNSWKARCDGKTIKFLTINNQKIK